MSITEFSHPEAVDESRLESLQIGRSKKDELVSLLIKHRTMVQYFVIGCMASAIDVILFLVLHNVFDQSTLVSQITSVTAAVIFSFFVNARHNFKTTDHAALRLVSFSLVCLFGMGVGYAVIELGVLASIHPNIGKFISLPVVFIVQFVLNSKITFRKI